MKENDPIDDDADLIDPNNPFHDWLVLGGSE